MITELTDAQISKFPEYVKRWTEIGLCTNRADRAAAESGIDKTYAVAKFKKPKIVWCGSPLSQGLTRAVLINKKLASVRASVGASVRASVWDSVRASVGASVRASVWDSVRASVRASVGDSVGASVRASVWDSVWASVGDSVGDSVWASVGASVGASVWDSVWASVGASVGASVWDSVRASVWDSVRASVWASVGDSVGASGYGQHDAGWIAYYNFLRVELGLKEETKKLSGLEEVCLNAGWFLPHKEICWICERHNTLHRNPEGRLHKDGSAALAYPDGFSIYALNGIRMNAEYVETPAERLEPRSVMKEENADIRRELIRKIGMDRMLAVLPNKKLDVVGNYELLSIQLSPEIKDARFLKMVNPSIGVFHLEGVDPLCDTVEKSLNWRNENRFTNAEILT